MNAPILIGENDLSVSDLIGTIYKIIDLNTLTLYMA